MAEMESAWSVTIENDFKLIDPSGRRVEVRNRKLRALIALCAMREPMVCSRRELASWLWREDSEESASVNLRQLLTQLRKLIGHDLVVADREIVKIVGMRRVVSDGEVMPGFEEPPFCRARCQKSDRLGSEIVNAFCATAEYLIQSSPHTFADFLLSSQSVLKLMPTQNSIDFLTLALSVSSKQSSTAQLQYLMGYALCLSSQLRKAGTHLGFAHRYSLQKGERSFASKVEEMMIHRSILMGDWSSAERLVDSSTEFAKLVYYEHRGSPAMRHRIMSRGGFTDQLTQREAAVLALFCVTAGETDNATRLIEEVTRSGISDWGIESTVHLALGYIAVAQSEFESAQQFFHSTIAASNYGQNMDFARYGVEGLQSVSSLTGNREAAEKFARQSQDIRRTCGFSVTSWDRARQSLAPL